MLLVAAVDHSAVGCREYVDVSRPQGHNKRMLHSVFVEVQPESTHRR
jgi:hypothetical protein